MFRLGAKKDSPTHSDVTVRPVLSLRDKHRFVRFTRDLYRDDPNFRPQLDLMVFEQLSPKHNPWFEHGDAQLYLAYRGDKVVGRISAQIDYEHLKHHDDGAGFFGFFEVEDDPEAAEALLRTAEDWVRSKGLERIRGPFSFSINELSGTLVDGFDSPNYIMMPHGRPYYDRLLTEAGYAQEMDLYCWRYVRENIPDRAFELAEYAADDPSVTIRDLDMDNLDRDIRIINDIFNEAWSKNWGYVPMTEAELDKMADEFRLVVDPELVMIAEVDGVPAGMTVSLPNINEAFRDLDGKVLPFGWAKALYRLKMTNPRTFRCILLGIRKEYRDAALGALSVIMYTEIFDRAYKKGYREAEASWTLESNEGINQGMELMGAEKYKTYRVYESEL
jgi:hypothetical protein